MFKCSRQMSSIVKYFIVCCIMVSGLAHAVEKIIILNPQGPTHSGTPQVIRLIETANQIQKKYYFIQEFKQGAFQSLALKEVLKNPQNTLSTIDNAVAEAVDRKFIQIENFASVLSQGDSCWAVIVLSKSKQQGIDAVKDLKELVIGGPAIGGATHITGLEIGKRYNIPVRYIVFKSNFDAFINMASENGVNFGIERVRNYNEFVKKNPHLKIVAMSCPTRHPSLPTVKTLAEHKIASPYIWQQILASRDMKRERFDEISEIFAAATKQIGQQEIFNLTDQVVPLFQNLDSTTHFNKSWSFLQEKRQQWKDDIRKTSEQ
jgi:tripartite-type tricarboxylate transporter receptor subunit TctC